MIQLHQNQYQFQLSNFEFSSWDLSFSALAELSGYREEPNTINTADAENSAGCVHGI